MQTISRFLLVALCVATWSCRTTSGGRTPIYLIRVDAGDTVAAIAAKYDTTYDKIAKLNDLTPSTPIKAGRVLRVEPGPGGRVAQESHASHLPKRVKNSAANSNANANENDNIQEEDYPTVERAPSNGAKGHGLLFGGGTSSGDPNHLEWPIFGELSSGYGWRGHHFHNGIDIRAKRGSSVLAAGNGVVEFAGRQHGYGKTVIIRHKNVKTLYAHLSSINVHVGDHVTHATEIAETGTSGRTTGPHLHFELRNMKNQSFDPLSVMEKDRLLSSAK